MAQENTTGLSGGSLSGGHLAASSGFDQLLDRAISVIDAARIAGADGADIVVSRSSSLSVSARLGQIESTDRSETDQVSLRVFVGRRVASVSLKADQLTHHSAAMVQRAVEMAENAPEDPYSALVAADNIATEWPDLDLFDPLQVKADDLAEQAIMLEDLARAHHGITNSNGAGASWGEAGAVLVTSNGFSGAYRRSSHGRSVSVVAGEGTAMERDYAFDAHTHLSDMRPLATIADEAATRTLERLNPRKVATQKVPVVFDRRVSSSFLGHFAGAINGASIARGSSFLKEALGTCVFDAQVQIMDDPFIPRASGSRPFDADGLSKGALELVRDGVLQHWLLDSYSARELGLQTNGRAGFAGSGTAPSASNLWMQAGATKRSDAIASMERGLIVTDFIGHGANLMTGDYSRGVSGFWVEQGEVVYPVSEMTLAGNLKDIFATLVPLDDLEFKGAVNAPSLMVEGLTLAGQ